jgi:radical SAM protein with 4Fe4S-binding SPASM domain
MGLGAAILRKARDVWKHPGFSGASSSLPRLAWQGLPYIVDPASARPPLTIYWNVNSVCNLHCKMCDVGTFAEESNFFQILRIDRKLHEISLDRFREVIGEVAAFRPMISIIATEPLMYKPLAKAVACAREAGLEVTVTTGGYDLPQRAEELAAAGLTRLNVSLDGPPALHNAIRGRKDVFERATDGVVRFKAAARRLNIATEVTAPFTITNLNFDRLVEFVDALAPFPFDRINFNYMTFVTREMAAAHNAVWGERYHATEMCLNEDVAPERVDPEVLHAGIARLKARGDRRLVFLPDYSLEELKRFFRPPFEFMGETPCMSTWFFAQIQANGEVIPFTRCYQVKLGNINEQPFMDIWNGERARAWRRDLRQHRRFPACTRCPLAV